MENEEFYIEFDNELMMQCEGSFEKISEEMKKDIFAKDSWMIATSCKIKSNYGVAAMDLHFYHNGDILIDDFQPSTIVDAYYNPDIRCISVWAQERGWNVPSPTPDLARMGLDFWRHFWESNIINSEYLDKIYGRRDSDKNDDNISNE